MELIDIAFSNNQVYMLKSFALSAAECQKQIEHIHYDSFYRQYKNSKDLTVENLQLPHLVYPFYSLVFRHKAVPHPEELIREYFWVYDEFFDDVDGERLIYDQSSVSKAAIISRLLRAYPSLIRDFHFYLMLVEQKHFDKVKYSCKNDICGIDITIEHNGNKYNVSLFADTPRANLYRTIKEKIRHAFMRDIELKLDFSTAPKCGDIYLYSQTHVDYLCTKILSKR